MTTHLTDWNSLLRMFIVGPPSPCVFSTKGPPAVDFGGLAMVTRDVVEAPVRTNTSQALPWSTSSQGWKSLGLWNRQENRSAIGMHAMSLRSFDTSKEQRMMPTFTILDVEAISIDVAGYLDRFSGVLGRSTMFTRSLWHWSHAVLDSLALPSTSFPLTTPHARVRPICCTPGANYGFKKIQGM